MFILKRLAGGVVTGALALSLLPAPVRAAEPKKVEIEAYVLACSTHTAENYLAPGQADKVLRATKLLGPGETDTVTFTPKAAGTYDYVCTFPTHYAAGMRGTITVE